LAARDRPVWKNTMTLLTEKAIGGEKWYINGFGFLLVSVVAVIISVSHPHLVITAGVTGGLAKLIRNLF